MTPTINKRRCPAEKDLCQVISICPTKAISHQIDETEPLGGKIRIDETRCNDCGACVDACCGRAIALN